MKVEKQQVDNKTTLNKVLVGQSFMFLGDDEDIYVMAGLTDISCLNTTRFCVNLYFGHSYVIYEDWYWDNTLTADDVNSVPGDCTVILVDDAKVVVP